MTLDDLSLLLSLRKVFGLAREGSGMARALVTELQTTGHRGEDVARKVLLGFPLSVSLGDLGQGKSEEVAILASLIERSAASSSAQVGVTGESLSLTLERWIKTRESFKIEDRVMHFRSLVAATVLGGITAMVGSIGPLLTSFSFSGPAAAADAHLVLYASAAMTALSSVMLGIFMSGRRFYLTVLSSLGAFAVVALLVSPLTVVPVPTLWGIK